MGRLAPHTRAFEFVTATPASLTPKASARGVMVGDLPGFKNVRRWEIGAPPYDSFEPDDYDGDGDDDILFRNGSKNKIMISGKARSTKEVSSLSINLNENSKYVNNALIIGTRDYEENSKTYSEFQLAAKLKSPTGEVTDKVNI